MIVLLFIRRFYLQNVSEVTAMAGFEPAPFMFTCLRSIIDYLINKLRLQITWWSENLLCGVKNNNFTPEVDLTAVYYQISIRQNDIGKTAFKVPSGCYAFRPLAFGLPLAHSVSKRLWTMFYSQFWRNFH